MTAFITQCERNTNLVSYAVVKLANIAHHQIKLECRDSSSKVVHSSSNSLSALSLGATLVKPRQSSSIISKTMATG
jgi:hypothetical protein